MSALAPVPTYVSLVNQIANYSYLPVKTTVVSAVAGFFFGGLAEKTATCTSQAVLSNLCANLILPYTIGWFFVHPQTTERAKGLYHMLAGVSSIAISYFIHKKVIQNITKNTLIIGKIKEEEEQDFKVITSEEVIKEGKRVIVNVEKVEKSPLGIPGATIIFMVNQMLVALYLIWSEEQ